MRLIKTGTYSGQTLIEVVLAIGIAVLVVVALVVLGSTSVRVAKSSLRRSEAAKLAAAGLEAVRYARDADGSTCGFSSLDIGCYRLNSTGSVCGVLDYNPAACGGTAIRLEDEEYTRTIKIEQYNGSPNKLLVTSVVTWKEPRGDKSVTLSTVLTNLKE